MPAPTSNSPVLIRQRLAGRDAGDGEVTALADGGGRAVGRDRARAFSLDSTGKKIVVNASADIEFTTAADQTALGFASGSTASLPMLLLFVVLLSALTTSEMLDEALIVVEAELPLMIVVNASADIEFTTAADQTALGFASGSTASSAITSCNWHRSRAG
jgi:hypothetical protein